MTKPIEKIPYMAYHIGLKGERRDTFFSVKNAIAHHDRLVEAHGVEAIAIEIEDIPESLQAFMDPSDEE